MTCDLEINKCLKMIDWCRQELGKCEKLSERWFTIKRELDRNEKLLAEKELCAIKESLRIKYKDEFLSVKEMIDWCRQELCKCEELSERWFTIKRELDKNEKLLAENELNTFKESLKVGYSEKEVNQKDDSILKDMDCHKETTETYEESESVSPAECEAVTSIKENKETLSDVSIPKVGDILEGRITGIVDYGAFVSAVGVKGLVHKSEISDKFVKSVADELAVGEDVRVMVIGVLNGRYAFSIKQLVGKETSCKQYSYLKNVADTNELDVFSHVKIRERQRANRFDDGVVGRDKLLSQVETSSGNVANEFNGEGATRLNKYQSADGVHVSRVKNSTDKGYCSSSNENTIAKCEHERGEDCCQEAVWW